MIACEINALCSALNVDRTCINGVHDFLDGTDPFSSIVIPLGTTYHIWGESLSGLSYAGKVRYYGKCINRAGVVHTLKGSCCQSFAGTEPRLVAAYVGR